MSLLGSAGDTAWRNLTQPKNGAPVTTEKPTAPTAPAPWSVNFRDGMWEVTCSDGSLGGRFPREGDARTFADVAGPGPMMILSEDRLADLMAEVEQLRATHVDAVGESMRRGGQIAELQERLYAARAKCEEVAQRGFDSMGLREVEATLTTPAPLVAGAVLESIVRWVDAMRAQDWSVYPEQYGAGKSGAVEEIAQLLLPAMTAAAPDDLPDVRRGDAVNEIRTIGDVAAVCAAAGLDCADDGVTWRGRNNDPYVAALIENGALEVVEVEFGEVCTEVYPGQHASTLLALIQGTGVAHN